ncbi:MAG: helix-turn-helix transcriptional regulator [Clostridia bacterium]|nr:helix-turn-helix transcriptional regulator [Clostridia bacterium]
MNIVERLGEIMRAKKINRAQLSRHLGLAPTTVQSWFNRGIDFPAQFVMPICEITGVTPAYLLSGEDHHANEIPEGYMAVSEDERFYVDTLRKLDREGVVVAMAAALAEARRVESESVQAEEEEGCAEAHEGDCHA